MISEPRGIIDYAEAGKGPTVVFVPGSCSTGAVWRPVLTHVSRRFRCVTTSLLGYGGTTERRSPGNASIVCEAEVVEAVARRAGGPVHLVGHSFGGLAALAAALRGQVPLLSLVVIEAPAPQILWQVGEHEHYRAFRQMTDGYFKAVAAGQSNAIERMIDFYGGEGTFAMWPKRMRDYAVTTTMSNVLDWEAAYNFQTTPIALGTVEVPALVVRGGDSHPAVQRANELLAYYMPQAAGMTLFGAAHFMIATHPRELADVIA
jgi:pimeloyl-ACP methyl ester carboxylesterase